MININEVEVGDKVLAICVDEGIGEYEIGDVLTVVGNTGYHAYIYGDEIEIAALTTSMFAEENRKKFVLLTDFSDIVIPRGFGLFGENTNEYLITSDRLKENPNKKYAVAGDVNVTITSQGDEVNPSDIGKFVSEALGVARPILETRKIGKDQMHMVNDGFPLALRHLAQIMTWAAEAKQYKLHDWRNLPDADIEFPSAEYRHANDNSIQKAEGLSALERVDHESGKLHIGHKIFNALCELELVLRGDIK